MLNKIISLMLAICFSSYIVASEQIVTTQPLNQTASAGQVLSFDVVYSTANPVNSSLTGLGLRMHWDSSVLKFTSISNLFTRNMLAQGIPESDTLNLDGDDNTDMYINIAWADFAGNWPGQESSIRLYTANFSKNNGANSNTTINFSSSSNAAGYTLNATSNIISNGIY